MFKIIRRVSIGVLIVTAMVACRGFNSSSSNATSSKSAPLFQLIILPEAGSKPVLDLLNSAQRSIRMTMYLLSDRDVMDALKSARGREVDVRVLIEAQPTGNVTVNQQTIKDLQAANITVKTSNPAFRLTHQKSIVIDERLAFITTANLTRASFTTNREYGIIDSNPDDIAEIINVFEADWKRTLPTVSNANLVWSPPNARSRLLSFIDGATKTLDIQAEEIQDKQVEDAITNAVKRGVQVRLITSPATNANKIDQTSIERLGRANVQVRWVKTPYIHARMMVADNARAFIGSENFSTTSLDSNRELGILITDSKIVQTLSSTFASDWNIGK
jgi:phosphatidylserine/phosphatidylglycerophosphate/cardiolipin synthase-like enzyme